MLIENILHIRGVRKIAGIISHISLSISSSNRRVNRSISSKWTAPIERSLVSGNYFDFVKYDFDKKSRSGGASPHVMIRSLRRRHGRNRGGGTLSRPLIYPARWVHQKGSIRWGSPIVPSARVGTRWSLRDCGYWQWQQAPREAWLGIARTEDPNLLTRIRADSRRSRVRRCSFGRWQSRRATRNCGKTGFSELCKPWRFRVNGSSCKDIEPKIGLSHLR